MEQMLERVARALCVAAGQDPDALSYHDGLPCWRYYINQADAALSLMQPEINRRVAEERAKLLERLREPSEAMIDAGCEEIAYVCDTDYVEPVWQAILAQFEKENNHD